MANRSQEIKNDELSIYEDHCAEMAEPIPGAMMENFRAIGYSLPAAVADIIDNSIFARAKNIWIDFICFICFYYFFRVIC